LGGGRKYTKRDHNTERLTVGFQNITARWWWERQCAAGKIDIKMGEKMWQGWQGWICALVALYCNSAPDVATIQAAYDRESSAGSKLHDKDLKVLQAKCHDDGKDGYLCEVMFTSTTDTNERLYFDIVAVARKGGGWGLQSGLCKR
jgi:hypothetical protein